MPNGLIHSYIEALGRTWRPHDDYYWPGRDSKNRHAALSSFQDVRGDSHEAEPSCCRRSLHRGS